MDHAIAVGYVEETPRVLWHSGVSAIYPLPDKEKSWKECDKLAQDTDESRYTVWKDDVEKMLIFVSTYY